MDKEKSGTDFSLIFDENTIPIIQQISEGMPGGFFIYHADGDEELIYMNHAMLRIFGCDTEDEFRDLTGYTFKGMVYPEDFDKVEESIASQIANSVYDLDYVEYRIVQKNGNIRWVEDYGHFIHTQTYGDIFCVFMEDATERLKSRMTELEKMNEQLRKAYDRESQYRKAILHDAACFLEINLTKDRFINATTQMKDGQTYGLFEFVRNHPFKKYSECIEFLSNNIESDELEEYRYFFDSQRLILCYDKGELEQTFDGWVTDSLGRKCLCHYIILLGRNEHTGDTVALFIAKDITEQEENQNLLVSALKQAESANMARNTFLANMSHDIRTPLNAIIGYADLVKSHILDQKRVKDYITKIRISGEQLLAIVDESLEITRMKSGRPNLKEVECHMLDLLDEVKKVAACGMAAKSIQFVIDSSQIQHFAVIADFIYIKEILCKLLDNAAKYTNPNGMVNLTVVETGFGFSGYGKYQFIIEDNGIGMTQEFLNVLFDPFKRENNTTQSGVLGTGLGLTVVKTLVDIMEGEIEVESELGKGSRFTVNLLLRLQKDQAAAQRTVTETLIDRESLKGKRILVVEDNEINREIAEELLLGQGYLVETAKNGSIALDKVKNSVSGYYTLILMDILMPVMDGYEATRAIRRLDNEELAHIPIIALSANAYAEDYHKSKEVGMNAHFPKPIDINSLQELIQTVLSGQG